MAQVLTHLRKLSPVINKYRVRGTTDYLDPRPKELKERLDRIDKASSGTVKTARSYYETNRKINILIVSVGIVLLANSIVYTWVKGIDYWSVFSGGLGITAFATLFFTKPQENITKALGNLAQVQMICKSYCLQFDIILDYHLKSQLTDIDEVIKINHAIQSSAQKAVKLIQSEVETDKQRETKEEINERTKKVINIESESG
jgi:hypothetical protein